jgi:hypothetical protein
MIERDVSGMQAYLAALRRSGVVNLRDHFRLHPEEIQRCLGMVKTVDCNDAFLHLLESSDKNELIAKMPRLVVGESFSRMAEEGILMVDEGTLLPEREMTIETLQGKRKRIMAQYMLLADQGNTLSRVVISLVDITKRMETEQALRASERGCTTGDSSISLCPTSSGALDTPKPACPSFLWIWTISRASWMPTGI